MNSKLEFIKKHFLFLNFNFGIPSVPKSHFFSKTSIGIKILGVLWLLILITSMGGITAYSYSPCPSGKSPSFWPSQSQIPLSTSSPTLIMFLHPHCPCSRASLGELEKLVALCLEKCKTHIVFIKPVGMPEDWMKTDLWREASKIPGATVHADSNGTEAKNFYIETSGDTVLYNSSGHLMFEGGITNSRGHSGDNAGRDALVALLNNEISTEIKNPVFGCPLFTVTCKKENK